MFNPRGLATATSKIVLDLDVETLNLHHVVFAQSAAVRRDGRTWVTGFQDTNFRAYGQLVPGTVVVLPEDNALDPSITVPLDENVTAALLTGFSSYGFCRRALLYARVRSTIRRLVERASFIQIQFPGSFGFVAASFAVAMNKPLYVYMHGSLQDPPGTVTPGTFRTRIARALYYQRATRRLARHARLLLSVSSHLHETFPPCDAPKIVAPNSRINEADIHHRSTACTSARVILFVATRMIESKGIHHLIHAVKRLVDGSRDVHLRVAGVGDYLPALRSLTEELGLDARVTFLGGVATSESLWKLYREADIVVLPSLGHYEGTPRMIMEAWAAGAPVIATTVGGIPAMMNHEKDGLLISPADEAAIASAIERICDNADLRETLVSGAYQRISAMTFERRVSILRRAFADHLPGLLPECAA